MELTARGRDAQSRAGAAPPLCRATSTVGPRDVTGWGSALASRWTVPVLSLALSLVTVPAVAAVLVALRLTTWLWLVGLGLGLAVANIVLVLLPVHFRIVRLSASLAALQDREAAMAEEREALLHETLLASDRERQRLAADLHDGVIQLVSAVTLRTATLARGLRREGDVSSERLGAAAASLDRITIDLQAVTSDLRNLMGALAGDEIQSGGLTGALSALLVPLAESGVHVDVSVGELSCDGAVRTLVHRVTQELARNVAKHAAAHRVTVSVSQEGDRVCLRMTDDGRGFDVQGLEERRNGGHLGLRLMDQRIRDAGGTLRIESTPGHGTVADISLPLSLAVLAGSPGASAAA